MKIALATMSAENQGLPDQDSPSLIAHCLFSDVVSSQKTPTSRGDQESVINSSNEGNSPFTDLDATKGSNDQEDLDTPDQGFNRWLSNHPNTVR